MTHIDFEVDDTIARLNEGTYLVIKRPGSTCVHYAIDPAFAPMIAAGKYAEDAIVSAIFDASELRVRKSEPLTPEQHKAWLAFRASLGDDTVALERCSYSESAQAGIAAMQKEADKMLNHPAVKRAWDNFMTVWALVKDDERKTND